MLKDSIVYLKTRMEVAMVSSIVIWLSNVCSIEFKKSFWWKIIIHIKIISNYSVAGKDVDNEDVVDANIVNGNIFNEDIIDIEDNVATLFTWGSDVKL